MAETDEEFVERMRYIEHAHEPLKEADRERLLSLAARGAAVRWRKIEEAPRDGTPLFGKLSNGWVTTMSHWADEYERYSWWRTPPGISIPVVETHDRDYDWTDHLIATHFIPLTALGEPHDCT